MTPIRRQYLRIKQRYPNAILFFRLGDFYETFDEDAKVASRELDIVLTSRSMGKGTRVPMAGVPAHAVESYLARLIKKGHRVAICEQLSDPTASKGLVDRDVVRVVTPGTVVEPSMLEQGANNYLAALVVDGLEAGLAYIDITTGEYAATQLAADRVAAEINRLAPAELLVPEGQPEWPDLNVEVAAPLDPRDFDPGRAKNLLLDHFQVLTLEAFGCENLPLATGAAGAILEYLSNTQPAAVEQVSALKTYSIASYMALDPQSSRNLELFRGGRWGGSELSLLSTLDFTRTSMGARLLRRWVGQPLLRLDELERRQEAVAFFHGGLLRREETRQALSKVSDLERIMGRVRLGKAVPRDLIALKESLKTSAGLLTLLEEDTGALSWLKSEIRPFDDLVALVEKAIDEEPSSDPREGSVIKKGFSADLDQLRSGAGDARDFIAGLERKEREATGIRSLKVGYNRVFGYYIEVRKASLARVPDTYIRRQTLVNGERFITPELKEYESLILNARERILELERDLYRQVCNQIGQQAQGIMALAQGIAQLDVLASLAEAASRYGYVRPTLVEEGPLDIKGGRHPIVERVLSAGTFVPNDLYLSTDDAQLLLITGPNMSGKSTFIRQAALITLMAQIGSFVPADSATVGLADRIFTRVGLQDDLATGQSTFMVEMVETAAILNQATRRSLVILDEIGRGTSTYDGLSIARAVAEHIHNDPRLGCRTLFATHYHELTQLVDSLPRVRNHTVAVTEEGGKLVFLHRIVPGGADRSYGVHVAQLAGLPRTVIHRAWEILEELEAASRSRSVNGGRRSKKRGEGQQVPLFSVSAPLIEELLKLDVTNMTPLEAINKLYELQVRAKEAG
ncbi:MAG: DNA mismatch repair protein MutS [Chloroflexi bacterium]|nr:DNA mismatch repair protein MutS [Chloroflexota bacterium]